MEARLVGRRPVVPASALVAGLVPPPHFGAATFATYVPDPHFPSQSDALGRTRDFVGGIGGAMRRRSSAGAGLYLDGGFGVGKTHLLTAMAHAVGGRAAYATFLEYTNLVGALGFVAARDSLAHFRLVCIDEFELDDPGDTLLMARLMRELADAGVAIAATSNTPPGALGQGRFAADDLRREIQALSSRFDVVRIDGPDYRHRERRAEFEPLSDAEVREAASATGGVVEEWADVVNDLVHVHPSRFGAYVDGIAILGLLGVAPLRDQNEALRVVSLVDRLYDRNVRVAASGVPFAQVFGEQMMAGGFRKKYQRALSRLGSMVGGEP